MVKQNVIKDSSKCRTPSSPIQLRKTATPGSPYLSSNNSCSSSALAGLALARRVSSCGLLKLTHVTSCSSLYNESNLDDLEESGLYLPNGTGDKLYLPRKDCRSSSCCSLDEYLCSIPCIARRSEEVSAPIRRLRYVTGRTESIDEMDELSTFSQYSEELDSFDHVGGLFIDDDDSDEGREDTSGICFRGTTGESCGKNVSAKDANTTSRSPLSGEDINQDASACWLTVMQGEVAHATPSQADILASTDATTCHVLALRSTLAGSSIDEDEPLSSMTHVDKAGYTQCLEEMLTYHMTYHNVEVRAEDSGPAKQSRIECCEDDACFLNYWDEAPNDEEDIVRGFVPTLIESALDESSSSMASLCLSDVSSSSSLNNDFDSDNYYSPGEEAQPAFSTNPVIEMEIHILGGFMDNGGKSQELSSHLIATLNSLAKKYASTIRMTLKTALITCMNSDKCRSNLNRNEFVAAPLVRGFGIHIGTGHVFALNDIPPCHQGPAQDLRSARLFSNCRQARDTLSVIHRPSTTKEQSQCHHLSSTKHALKIKIEPFTYQSLPSTEALLKLPNETLLLYTSTSPECEDSNKFCSSLRSTLKFLDRFPAKQIFGPLLDQPLTLSQDPKTCQWQIDRLHQVEYNAFSSIEQQKELVSHLRAEIEQKFFVS